MLQKPIAAPTQALHYSPAPLPRVAAFQVRSPPAAAPRAYLHLTGFNSTDRALSSRCSPAEWIAASRTLRSLSVKTRRTAARASGSSIRVSAHTACRHAWLEPFASTFSMRATPRCHAGPARPPPGRARQTAGRPAGAPARPGPSVLHASFGRAGRVGGASARRTR